MYIYVYIHIYIGLILLSVFLQASASTTTSSLGRSVSSPRRSITTPSWAPLGTFLAPPPDILAGLGFCNNFFVLSP